ncbi:TolC family protein [Salegentibacter sediminis]|uniref:TolC family protein n=1 Tax=Salegentibacter sediminis TaxID=1930251 RepID=UPI0009BD419D|nr:TolC family protein [Salegentibacter sediminis]
MSILKKILLLLLTIFQISPGWAQEFEAENILTFEEYIELVKANHPVARQAENRLQIGEADIQQARGVFDPKIFNNTKQKNFKGTEYYSIIESGLKIPTWFGIELHGGYDLNEGAYLNPQNLTPANGLWYGGISVSLGEGLFIDERRAELRKAQLFQKMTQMERELMLNELIYEAGKAYWKWFESYSVMQTYKEAIEIAEERYQGVRQSSLAGEVAAIDTTEARIQVQNNRIGYNEARLEFENASELISVYLWLEGVTPLEIAEGTIPAFQEATGIPIDEQFLGDIEELIEQHPELRRSGLKVDQLEIDRRWSREQLKPELNLKYNVLTESIDKIPSAEYSLNNYNFGLEFEMPLFLRKERGKVKLANLKIADARLDLDNYRANLKYKARAALNEWKTSNQQLEIYRQNVENTRRLLEGERRMFRAGESSLFMVNSRQMSYINAQNKFFEYISKNRIARLKTFYRFGLIGE